jgi:TPR repeat protein
MKFWQVQGEGLQEIRCEPISDEQRLQEWLAPIAVPGGEVEWVVESPKTLAVAEVKANSQQKPPPPPSDSSGLQETKARALKGDANAQAALGFRYELGIDVPADSAEAARWYRKAAQQGNFRAQTNLERLVAQGPVYEPGSPEPKDSAEAVKWCRKAAEQGDMRAQFNLAQMYEYGDGMARHAAEAVKWYKKAAESEDSAAQYILGLCYCNGQGVPQNTGEAVRWWRAAAEQDEPAAQYMLGLCYCNAQGVPQDYAEAVKWYHLAAEQGDAQAQSKLADAYYIGVGVPANHFEAVRWYTEAAEQGVASAQRHLGIMYGLGQGVPKNPAEAYKWYTLAAEQHDNNAIHNRNSISSSMTPSQIAEGRKLSQDFSARKQGGEPKPTNGQLAFVPTAPEAARSVKSSPTVKRIVGKNILGMDVLVLGTQVPTMDGGCIDLLAIDKQANLVALELKRNKTPQEIIAQTLDHASWVKSLSEAQVDALSNGSIGKPLAQAFKEHFGHALPEKINAGHSMMILTPALDAAAERILRYLARQHAVPIVILFTGRFKTPAGEFVVSAET